MNPKSKKFTISLARRRPLFSFFHRSPSHQGQRNTQKERAIFKATEGAYRNIEGRQRKYRRSNEERQTQIEKGKRRDRNRN